MNPRGLLRRMFEAAIEAAQPAHCLPPFLPAPTDQPLVVIGAGKASAEMARVVEQHRQGPLRGIVITRYGHGVPCRHIDIIEAGHPVPDDAGILGTERILRLADELTEDDTVLCLLSGGGSSLLVAPLDRTGLDEKQQLSRALLRSGATIGEINCVRRHLSKVKGGRLATRCYPARVISLIISDVPGDGFSDIASGPTVADPTTCEQALDILLRYGIEIPESIRGALQSGRGESVKPGDPGLERTENHLVATPQRALEAAAAIASQAGITPYILGDAIEGEARAVGRAQAGIARQVVQRGEPFEPPCVLLSGGETTVTVKGNGTGGRNVEFLLSLAIELDGCPGVYAVAGDTDGIDGQGTLAGALVTPDTLERAAAKNLDPEEALHNNDAHTFFSALGDSIQTGPTLTNVNDFRAILVEQA